MDKTTISQRRIMGVLGLVLPVLTLIFGLITGESMSSISETHYNPQYLIFEGVICAVCWFLIAYQGYDIGDRISTIIAGVCGLLLAYFPTNGDIDWNFACIPSSITTWVHYITALAFFITLSYISFFRFTKTSGEMTERKKIRNIIYKTLGVLMLVFIFVGGAIDFILVLTIDDLQYPFGVGALYYGEWLGLWCFGFSWLIKGRTILKDKEVSNG